MKTLRYGAGRCAALLLVLSPGSAALAQDSVADAADIPALEVGKSLRPASFDARLQDRGNQAAKELAAVEGISVGEATKRLRLARQAANQAYRDVRRGKDFLLRPRIRGDKVTFLADKGAGKVALAVVREGFDADLQGAVESTEIARPLGQLKSEVKRIGDALGPSEGVTGIRVNVEGGNLVILSVDRQKTLEAVSAKGLDLPDFVTIETSDPIVLTADIAIAGNRAGFDTTSCGGGTWGFAGYQNGDITKPGLLTAAHVTRNANVTQLRLGQSRAASSCGSGSTWQPRRLDWRGGAYSDRLGIDIAFHNQSAGTSYYPWFFDGTANSKVLDAMFPPIGTRVCKYGVTTGKTCGTVEADLVWSNGYGYMTSVLVDAAYPLGADLGDSGGPVWFGTNTAVGVEHAQWTSRRFLYSEVQSLQDHVTGITLATSS